MAADAAVERYADAAKKIGARWDTFKSAEERGRALAGAAVAELAAIGVHPPDVVVLRLDGPGDAGEFFKANWTIRLSRTYFEGRKPDDAALTRTAAIVAHEARHCEQDFRVLRLIAGRGKAPAKIAADRNVPTFVVERAAKDPLEGDGQEADEAREWFWAGVGIGAIRGNLVINRLDRTRALVREADAEYVRVVGDPSSTPEQIAEARRVMEEARAKFDEAYAAYKALPNEADAFEVSDDVEEAMRARGPR